MHPHLFSAFHKERHACPCIVHLISPGNIPLSSFLYFEPRPLHWVLFSLYLYSSVSHLESRKEECQVEKKEREGKRREENLPSDLPPFLATTN